MSQWSCLLPANNWSIGVAKPNDFVSGDHGAIERQLQTEKIGKPPPFLQQVRHFAQADSFHPVVTLGTDR